MKKTLYELFDEATPAELDNFSKELEASVLSQEVLSSVKNKVYVKTKLTKSEKGRIITMKREKKFTRIFGGILASAACFALVVGCFAGYNAFFKHPATEVPNVVATVTLDFTKVVK